MNIAPFIRLPADPTRTSVLFDVLPRAPGTRPGDMRDAILAIGSHRNPDRLAVSIGAGSVMHRILCEAAGAMREGHAFEIRLTREQLAEAATLYEGTDVRLPFPVTPVLCTIDPLGPFLAVCTGDDSGRLGYAATFGTGIMGNLHSLHGLILLKVLHDDGSYRLAVPAGIEPDSEQLLGGAFEAAVALLGIIADDRRPATLRLMPGKLNLARHKAGKPEIPPVWQVEYVTWLGRREAKPYVDHGGTHASPRPHDRRGHRRHLSNGRAVWVRSCHVGETARHMSRGHAFYTVGGMG